MHVVFMYFIPNCKVVLGFKCILEMSYFIARASLEVLCNTGPQVNVKYAGFYRLS